MAQAFRCLTITTLLPGLLPPLHGPVSCFLVADEIRGFNLSNSRDVPGVLIGFEQGQALEPQELSRLLQSFYDVSGIR